MPTVDVEGTLELVGLLESYNKLAEEEEDVLQRGYALIYCLDISLLRITLDGVQDFLASLNSVSEAQTELEKRKLDFCSGTSGRLVMALLYINLISRPDLRVLDYKACCVASALRLKSKLDWELSW